MTDEEVEAAILSSCVDRPRSRAELRSCVTAIHGRILSRQVDRVIHGLLRSRALRSEAGVEASRVYGLTAWGRLRHQVAAAIECSDRRS